MIDGQVLFLNLKLPLEHVRVATAYDALIKARADMLPLEHVRVATSVTGSTRGMTFELPLEHVRVATPQQFQSMLEFETCERVDFVVNVRCCKNSVRLTTIVEMLNMLFTAFAVRGCMG